MLKNTCALIIFLVAFNYAAQADEKTVYKKYNNNGVVEFSDLPSKNAKPVYVPPMNTYKHESFPVAVKEKAKQKIVTGYRKLSITSPTNDSIVRGNGGQVTTTVKVEPALKPGDSIKVVLNDDKKLTLVGTRQSFTFINISRGTHKLQAFIVSKAGKVLIQSNAVTFHLQRVSVHTK